MTGTTSPTSTGVPIEESIEESSTTEIRPEGAVEDLSRHRSRQGSSRQGRSSRERWRSSWPWLLGVVAGLVTLGPALAPGSIFSLDLVLTPEIPVPRGAWGLGPELPRRFPLMLPAAWLSAVVPGWLIGKAMIVSAVATAFVGVHRLLRDRSELAAAGAGLLYAINPFMLTRIGVGHLALVVAMAVMPWALPTLLRPGDRPPRTFLWCLALGFTGNYGGMISLFMVLAGLANTRFRRWPRVLVSWLVAQLPWLVPGLIVLNQGGYVTDGSAFTTIGRGAAGKAQILAGHGFWNFTFQAGFTGVEQRLEDQLPIAIAALGLLALAVVGARDLPRDWRWAAAALAGLGAFLAVVSSFEYDANPYFALARTPIGANLRESQRALPLYLVWMAPAAGLGAIRIGGWLAALLGGASRAWGNTVASLVAALPLGAAVFLGAPGLWGLEGHLRSTEIPESWEAVKAKIDEAPGTVAVLPWHAYGVYDLGGKHLVINPWPYYLGGDVLVCSNPGRTTGCSAADHLSERADPREPAMRRIALRAKDGGGPVAEDLAGIGVRWLVLARVPGGEGLTLRDPGLERVLSSDSVELYAVRPWRGLVVARDGIPVESSAPLEPLVIADGSGAAVLAKPDAPGWRRGLTATARTPEGLIGLPEGGGPIWYWPSVLVMGADIVCAAFVVFAIRGSRREGLHEVVAGDE